MVKGIRTNLSQVVIILFSVFVVSVFVGSSNLSSTSYAQNPNIDPQAAEILQNMSYFLGSKDEYTFKAEVMFDQLITSQRAIQYSAEQKVFMKKKNNLTIEFISDLGGYKLWFEEGKLTVLELPTNLYSIATLPATIDQALDKLKSDYNFTPSLSDFLYINIFRALTQNVTSGNYFGTSRVFGVRCDHLAFVQPNIDWQIWIESGKRQIPRKLVITYKNLPGKPQYIAILRDWVIDKPITNFAFKPDIPDLNQRTDMSEILNKPRMNMGSVRSTGQISF
ncbi:MAG: DUF2092 domain-containing protein [Thermodesulfobacteriota bacterium]